MGYFQWENTQGKVPLGQLQRPYASKAYLKNSRCDNPVFLIKPMFLMTSGSLRFGQGLGKT